MFNDSIRLNISGCIFRRTLTVKSEQFTNVNSL